MRICSLLPSATEMVYALGLGDKLVGVSHTCDYPYDASSKPVVSRSIRQIRHLSSVEIDSIIQQARANNNPLYWIDEDLLRQLRPDVILTQEICEVCAISSGSVYETAAKALDYQPEFVTVRPAGLEDIFNNIKNIGKAADVPDRSSDLVRDLRRRVKRVKDALPGDSPRPKVFCIDWLDPTPQHRPVGAGTGGTRRRRRGLGAQVGQVQGNRLAGSPGLPTRLHDDDAMRLRGRSAWRRNRWLGWRANPDTTPCQQCRMTRSSCSTAAFPAATVPRVVDVLEGSSRGHAPRPILWPCALKGFSGKPT